LFKESRWIPLLAVVLLVCLGAICVLGVVGGTSFLGRLTGTEEASRTLPSKRQRPKPLRSLKTRGHPHQPHPLVTRFSLCRVVTHLPLTLI
jgi:hypothetical protein